MLSFKINTRDDAIRLANLFVRESSVFDRWHCPAYGADKPFIQLWDEMDSNRIMVFIEPDDSYTIPLFRVRYIDTVRGTERGDLLRLSEIVEAIWHNRKFINQSGQLDNI